MMNPITWTPWKHCPWNSTKTLENAKPADVVDLVDNVKKRLGKDEQYMGLIYSHETSSITQGPKICLYKTLPTMKEKVNGQISLAEKILCGGIKREWWKES